MSFTPLPLDHQDPLSNTQTTSELLTTPPINNELESSPMFTSTSDLGLLSTSNPNDRFSSYSNNSLRDSFISTNSQRPLFNSNETSSSSSRLTIGERRSSNLSGLNLIQQDYGSSEEEKAEESELKSDRLSKNIMLPEGSSMGFGGTSRYKTLDQTWFERNITKTKNKKRRNCFIFLIFLLLFIIIIGSTVGTLMMKKRNSFNANTTNNNANGSNISTGTTTTTTNGDGTTKTTTTTPNSTGGTSDNTPTKPTSGINGSLIYLEDGTNFIYNNTFGGNWNSIPFVNTARAQSDVPALNEAWDYNVNLIDGVNLGGWLVIEPFIVPGLFEPFESSGTVVDEWTLSIALGRNLAPTITNHYETFITEKDFAEIAGAGLNWVRIPIPYWAVEVYPGEPFLANVAWNYFLKAITWARKYGLRINLDLHAVPGSQNGYNHSSKLGTINFLNGVMGLANAQRTLDYIRTLTEFISQDQYSNVIPMFSIMNEPYAATIGVDTLRHFYTETYNMIRGITGVGEGKGPIIVYHDGFAVSATPVSAGGWNGFLNGADRISIDQHPYLCFSAPNVDSLSYQASKPCTYWARQFNSSTANFGIAVGGEWSLAINDCGKWINNVGNGARFDGTYFAPGVPGAPQYAAVGSCDTWNDWENYSAATKAGLQTVAQGHQDALKHWFFWTWKTGFSTTLGKITNPLWNYQLALEQGYMPKNPRAGRNTCPSIIAAAGVAAPAVTPAPSLAPYMTGGVGAGTIFNVAQSNAYAAWPPITIGAPNSATPVEFLPTYTATGNIITMPHSSNPTPAPTPSLDFGNGWKQPLDSAGFMVPIIGCTYYDAWNANSVPVPTAVCTGA